MLIRRYKNIVYTHIFAYTTVTHEVKYNKAQRVGWKEQSEGEKLLWEADITAFSGSSWTDWIWKGRAGVHLK